MMKKLIYLFGFFMVLLMSSCLQDEVFYSCDPTVSFCTPCSYDVCEEKSWECGLLGLGICNGVGC